MLLTAPVVGSSQQDQMPSFRAPPLWMVGQPRLCKGVAVLHPTRHGNFAVGDVEFGLPLTASSNALPWSMQSLLEWKVRARMLALSPTLLSKNLAENRRRHSSPRKGSRGSGISPHRFKYEQRNGGNHKVHSGRKREYPIPMTAKVLE